MAGWGRKEVTDTGPGAGLKSSLMPMLPSPELPKWGGPPWGDCPRGWAHVPPTRFRSSEPACGRCP